MSKYVPRLEGIMHEVLRHPDNLAPQLDKSAPQKDKSALVFFFFELFPLFVYLFLLLYMHTQGLAVIFSHHQVCIKKKKGGYFFGGGPKVKVEFRHLFSLQKRFSLFSSHKINANIDVFC